MSIDPGVLKRLLYLKITIEGPGGWVFRELVDYVEELVRERLSMILSEAVDVYGLEISIIDEKGCDIFPEESLCKDMITVEIYEKDSDKPLAYTGYVINKGQNTFEVKTYKIIDAETRRPI